MEIVRAFNSNSLHTDIVIKGTHNDPLFRASDIGEILEMSNIRVAIQNYDDTERHVSTTYTSTGPKQVTFLTEKGLYKVLFKSRKPIAEKFQDWVCEVIKELRLKGTYDLQKQLEQTKLEMEEKLASQQIVEKEKILLKEYGHSGSLVYIIRVKTFLNGEYIIKIGHSAKGIHNRYNDHKGNYEECVLLNCFSVDRSRDFENFLHNHEQIRDNKVTNLENHEKEQELFLVGKNLTHQMILKIVENNIQNYNYKISELLKENELLNIKLQSTQTNTDNELLRELLKTVNNLNSKISGLEKTNKEILEKLNSQQTKIVSGFNEPLANLGPRLQKINPETLQLIKVYESISECMKENNNIKRPSINKAIEECTVYNGFRWLLVDRDLDPTIILNIKPTKITKSQNLGYIAKLNAEKTEIINVYLDRKTAANENGYTSTSALDNPVKNGTITNGHYYALYDSCDNKLQNEFISKNNDKEPMLYKNGVGQYDSQGNLIREFICKYDCIKSLCISDKTLEKALTKNIPYNNYYYKYLGAKLKCM
jgi:prophage antirepressor-like protein